MGILKRSEVIRIISEIRNTNKENVILYNENEYNLCQLLHREEKALYIQYWWKNYLDKKYMKGFQEDIFSSEDFLEWFCWGCGT